MEISDEERLMIFQAIMGTRAKDSENNEEADFITIRSALQDARKKVLENKELSENQRKEGKELIKLCNKLKSLEKSI